MAFGHYDEDFRLRDCMVRHLIRPGARGSLKNVREAKIRLNITEYVVLRIGSWYLKAWSSTTMTAQGVRGGICAHAVNLLRYVTNYIYRRGFNVAEKTRWAGSSGSLGFK